MPGAVPCHFSSATLDYLLDFLADTGIFILFDLNELYVEQLNPPT